MIPDVLGEFRKDRVVVLEERSRYACEDKVVDIFSRRSIIIRDASLEIGMIVS